MGLFELIIVIAVFGLLVWAVQQLIPMPLAFKNAITVVAIIGLVFYVLQAFGFLGHFRDIRIK